MERAPSDRSRTVILLLAATGLIAGLALRLVGKADLATLARLIGVVPALAALVVEALRNLRAGEVGPDIVAALSMTAALVFGETGRRPSWR